MRDKKRSANGASKGDFSLETESLVVAYLRAKRSGWAEATYMNRRSNLIKFSTACPRLPSRPEPIEDFLTTIENDGYRYNVWCSVRLLYQWGRKRGVRRGVLRRPIPDPCPLVEAPAKPEPMHYYLNVSELARLLTYPHSPRDRALLWLLADTGMRRGEAHSMTVEHMHDSGDGSGWVYVTGKTGPRWVPVSAPAWALVKAIAPSSGPVWRSLHGHQRPLRCTGTRVRRLAVFRARRALG
jgi:integrase